MGKRAFSFLLAVCLMLTLALPAFAAGDSIHEATPISLNESYIGHLVNNDDKDFYEFTLPTSGRVTFNATARMRWIYYTLYDSDGSQLWRVNPSWNSTLRQINTNETVTLTQGTNYLAVSKDGTHTGNYEICLSRGSIFSDVPTGAYYEPAVNWAVTNSITNGTGGTTFSPNINATRGQAVTFLWRAPEG